MVVHHSLRSWAIVYLLGSRTTIVIQLVLMNVLLTEIRRKVRCMLEIVSIVGRARLVESLLVLLFRASFSRFEVALDHSRLGEAGVPRGQGSSRGVSRLDALHRLEGGVHDAIEVRDSSRMHAQAHATRSNCQDFTLTWSHSVESFQRYLRPAAAS